MNNSVPITAGIYSSLILCYNYGDADSACEDPQHRRHNMHVQKMFRQTRFLVDLHHASDKLVARNKNLQNIQWSAILRPMRFIPVASQDNVHPLCMFNEV